MILLPLVTILAAPPLTLRNVLDGIGGTHPRLLAARQEISIARAKIRERRGAFDPVVGADVSTLRYNPSTAPGTPYGTSLIETGIEFPLREGSRILIGARRNTGKVKSPATATGDLGEGFVAFRVPLARDRGVNARRIAEDQARLEEPLAEARIARVNLDLRREAASAYWEWVAAGARRRIAREALELARRREGFLLRRLEVGDVPEVDAIEARAETETRRGNLVKAERDVEKAAFRLGLYIWTEGGASIVPADAEAPPGLAPPSAPPLPEAVAIDAKAAVATRPEPRAIEAERRGYELERDLARNDARPALDLLATPGYDAGFSGIGLTSRLGVLFSVPIGQNAARGRRAQAESRLVRTDANLTLLRATIENEVRDAASALNRAVERWRAAQAVQATQAELVEKERLRFEAGEGTLFLLNQRERALVEAQARVVDAQAEALAAEVAYAVARGEL